MAKRQAASTQPEQHGQPASMVEAAAEVVGRAAGRVLGAVNAFKGAPGARGRLQDAFLDELKDAYDAEKQLVKALPKLARAATDPALRSAFESHLEETRGHVEKLEQVFALLDERARGKHCDGIAGIVKEGSAVMQEDFEDATMDACLIAAGQRTEHYEMAAYGTLVAWASVIGRADAAKILDAILAEEKAADAKLNALAEGGINPKAAGDADAAPGKTESNGKRRRPGPKKARSSRKRVSAKARR